MLKQWNLLMFGCLLLLRHFYSAYRTERLRANHLPLGSTGTSLFLCFLGGFFWNSFLVLLALCKKHSYIDQIQTTLFILTLSTMTKFIIMTI